MAHQEQHDQTLSAMQEQIQLSMHEMAQYKQKTTKIISEMHD